MKNKKLIITLSIIAVLVLTIGITYSIFTSSKTSKNSNLVVGDIYMHYNETNQIQMENAMPTNLYIVNPIMATQEYTKGGTNELSKCVDAFVNIDAPENETLSMCKEDSSTIIEMLEYGELDAFNLTDTFMQENIIIFNSTIPYFEFTVDGKNTTTNKDIWYEVVLSKGDNLEGKTRIKDNLLRFRLIETKDNKETIVVDNKSYSDLTSKRIWVDTINKNTTSEVVHTYRLYMWISNDTVIGNVNQDYTMEEWKNVFASIKVGVSGDFNEKILTTDEACFTTTEVKSYRVNSNMTDEELNKCVSFMTDKNPILKEGETIESFCKGTGTMWEFTFQDIIELDVFTNTELASLETNNIINSAGVFVAINDYNASCGADVVIPGVVNGKNVAIIGAGAFFDKQLTNVVIPSSVKKIADYAFYQNQLISVNFSNPSTLKKIEMKSFRNNDISSVVVPDSVSYLSCGAFDSTVAITKSDNLVCTNEVE